MLGPEGLLVNLPQPSTFKTLPEDLAELPQGRLSKYFTIKHELGFSYGSGLKDAGRQNFIFSVAFLLT